jgi:L-alanine-DL-glutamate epimerase-like enolase superfamily enzyme
MTVNRAEFFLIHWFLADTMHEPFRTVAARVPSKTPACMPKSTDITILEAHCTFEPVAFRSPLKFGGRVMDKGALINVEVRVETRNKRLETGLGSMPLAPVWAWPSTALSVEQAEEAMKAFAREIIELAADYPDYAHPIDITEQILGEYNHLAKQIQQRQKLPEPIPYLAQLVAASPLDAALHDAYGRVHGKNSYDLLSQEYANHDLSEYLDASFKGEYLDRYTLREPKNKLPLYHLVGALDPLAPDDVTKKIGDGLPEHLGEWIRFNGLTHLKIKLNGDDLAWDVDRVLSVERVAIEAQGARGCTAWCYSLDFNEKCPSVEYVLDFLNRLREKAPAAYDRVQYIEQPTHRDLKAHPENKMHEAAKLKPVVVDESLVDYDSLLLAREQGYTGLALKACKGHTGSLLLGAAGQKLGMFLCVQDLTCPGFSFLHSASLAARIPGIAAIEGNGRQYCPAANRRWRAQFPAMFDIKDGTVGTGVLNGIGLGF